jgi:nicotinamidase-related amidase
LLVIAGEASSHCVAATLTDLLDSMTPDERARVVILRDCMSPVKGFEADADRFFAAANAQGARVMSANEASAELA